MPSMSPPVKPFEPLACSTTALASLPDNRTPTRADDGVSESTNHACEGRLSLPSTVCGWLLLTSYADLKQLASGVALHPTIMPELAKWAGKLDVPLPEAAA